MNLGQKNIIQNIHIFSCVYNKLCFHEMRGITLPLLAKAAKSITDHFYDVKKHSNSIRNALYVMTKYDPITYYYYTKE